jgi:hypothetical protein
MPPDQNIQTKEMVQSIRKDSNHEQGGSTDQVLLITSPEKMSFIFKYFLALTPCILVFVSIVTRFVLDIIIRTFSAVMNSTMSGCNGLREFNE